MSLRNKFYVTAAFMLLAIGNMLAHEWENPPTKKQSGAQTKATVLMGYNNGLGLNASYAIANFAKGFPLTLRLGFNYSYINNPGVALDARHIFINGNSNGTPEKQGRFMGVNFDFVYPLSDHLSVYVGVRKIKSVSNFNFVGGNEDFDIITSPWGAGFGIDANFPINSKLSLLISGGSGYYFPAEMEGHGTIYRPDGEDIQTREDYVYADADQAVNQPKIELKAMIGLCFTL